MNESLINQIINAGILRAAEPPRDSWLLGTATGTPAAGLAPVILDGDSTPTSIIAAVGCANNERVLTCLLGRNRILVANLTTPAGGGTMTAADILTALKTVDGSGSGLDADLLDGLNASSLYRKTANAIDGATAALTINGNGEIASVTNTTGSVGFPTAYGYTWLLSGNTYQRDLLIHRTTGGAVYIGTVNATRDGVTGWNLLWHDGNDGSGSGLDADLLDGNEAAAFLLASAYTAADVKAKLLTVDGAGSTIDADLLDGQQGSYYAPETAATVAGLIHAATSKATPVDADEIDLIDSAASYGLKKLTWANLKATLKTYFDTLYAPKSTLPGRMAYGTVTLGSASWTTGISLGTTFSAAPKIVISPVTSTSGVIAPKTNNITTSTFEATIGGSGFTSIVCHWIAIGT